MSEPPRRRSQNGPRLQELYDDAKRRYSRRSLFRVGAGAALAIAAVTVVCVALAAAAADLSEDEEGLVGMTGTFVASPSARALGRVMIRRGEHTVAFAARPVVGVTGPDRWDAVVIVDVYHGTALVAPVEREGPRA